LLGLGVQISDGTARHHMGGTDVGIMCLLGTFAHHTVVNEATCIKVDPDIPLDKACLLGCGVVTGWGSSVYAAEVTPGDTVAVVGAGGIGVELRSAMNLFLYPQALTIILMILVVVIGCEQVSSLLRKKLL
jgi:Zn-dependent alcohol dehydrogenase